MQEEHDEILVSANSLDFQLDSDPLAEGENPVSPSVPDNKQVDTPQTPLPTTQPQSATEQPGQTQSLADMYNEVKTLKEMAARLENLLGQQVSQVAELPSQASEAAETSGWDTRSIPAHEVSPQPNNEPQNLQTESPLAGLEAPLYEAPEPVENSEFQFAPQSDPFQTETEQFAPQSDPFQTETEQFAASENSMQPLDSFENGLNFEDHSIEEPQTPASLPSQQNKLDFGNDPFAVQNEPEQSPQPTFGFEEYGQNQQAEIDFDQAALAPQSDFAHALQNNDSIELENGFPEQNNAFAAEESFSGQQEDFTQPSQDAFGLPEDPYQTALEHQGSPSPVIPNNDPFSVPVENTSEHGLAAGKSPFEPPVQHQENPFGQPVEQSQFASEPAQPTFAQHQMIDPFAQEAPSAVPEASQDPFLASPQSEQAMQSQIPQPSGIPNQPQFSDSLAQPNAALPDPYGDNPYNNVASTQPALQQGSGNPLDQFLAQDILAAIAFQGGSERLMDNKQVEALTNLRNKSKELRQGRTKHNTRKKGGAPKFIRMNNMFRPGDPLMISVTSPKGGVGKSTTAANLAAYFAKAAQINGLENEVRVLLVDGDVANGNLALRVARQLQPNMLDLLRHMDEVLPTGGDLDNYERDMAEYVLGHPKLPNLDVLAAPDNPDILEKITQSDLEYLRDTFAKFYQIVIFDTGTQIVEHTNCAWLSFSSQVYLMVEPEIACLQVTAEYARRARRLQLITPQECRLIMIRSNMEIENLDPKKIAADIFSFIPPDRSFFISDYHRDSIETGNAGEFLTLDSADYAAALRPIAQASLDSYEKGL